MNAFVFVLCLVGVVMLFVYKMASIGVNRSDSTYNTEETELIQDMHRQLLKMDERIESLETILVAKAESEDPPTLREVLQRERMAR